MSRLVTVATGHQLVEEAAYSYLRARADGCPAGITSSTRSEALQWSWYRNRGRPGFPKMADHPDRSKHVYRPGRDDEGARALDLPEPARSWMRENGADYGWHADRVAGEPWHFEYEHDSNIWRHYVLIRPQDRTAIADEVVRKLLDDARVYNGPGKTITVRQAIAQSAILDRQTLGEVRDLADAHDEEDGK